MDECHNLIAYEEDELYETLASDATDEMGQSESKKSAKKNGAETKGTAMSFGFRKISQGLSHKKNTNLKSTDKGKGNKIKGGDSATVISNPALTKDNYNLDDTNGNKASAELVSAEDDQTGRTTPRLLPPKKDASGVPYRPNRFGFRHANIIRPASVGLTPKLAENYCSGGGGGNNNNNNFIAEKRRSKSASAATTTTTAPLRSNAPIGDFSSNHHHEPQKQHQENPKIISTTTNYKQQQQAPQEPQQENCGARENLTDTQLRAISSKPSADEGNHAREEKQQYTVVQTNIHTNQIVKPTPQQPDCVTKFTLRASILPKPQYAVPVNLPPFNVMDTKIAKQAVNSSRKTYLDHREQSSDSGVASFDSYAGHYDNSSRRSARYRPRNLQMVMKGRNYFEVRDFDDSLSDDTIVPLMLPKLPSAFDPTAQPAELIGLVRSGDNQDEVDDYSSDMRKLSNVSSDIESIEEEMEEVKVSRDKTVSEKRGVKDCTLDSINVSPASSRVSWDQAGETMAVKECSSLSLSSSDESRNYQMDTKTDMIDDEISSVTITLGNILSSLTTNTPSIFNASPHDQQQQQLHFTQPLSTSPRNVFLQIKDTKFAEVVAAAKNEILLDDETSPTDSLVSSSTDSDDLGAKKIKKKLNDAIKEHNNEEDEEAAEDLDDQSISLEKVDITSPMSPGTPTHASFSLSLSEGAGRDFLIDDEIADQPELVFDEPKDINDDFTTTNLLHSITDTLTMMDTGTNKTSSAAQLPAPVAKLRTINPSPVKMGSTQSLTKSNNVLVSRAESLDTLSPCESIASDDLMMDFEIHSSMDSIDRDGMFRSNIASGSGSALHSMDETQLWSELEAKGADLIPEWSSLLRSQKKNTRESITSQLPARATRLLNRSRLQQSPSITGSDSPRSLDGVAARRTPLLKSQTLGHEDMVLVDKSLKNSMLQDMVYFKKQLVRLRRLLQEDEDTLKRTDTLNPFEHGQFFASMGLVDLRNHSITEDRDSGSLTPSLTEDPKAEMSDLRRQVVYLQSQIEDRDRTIKLQQSLINKLEEEKERSETPETNLDQTVERVNTATQTERVRPLSMGHDGITRSEQQQHQQFKSQPNSKATSTSTSPVLRKQIPVPIINTSSPSSVNKPSSNIYDRRLPTLLLARTVKTAHTGNVMPSKKTNLLHVERKSSEKLRMNGKNGGGSGILLNGHSNKIPVLNGNSNTFIKD